MDKVSYDQRLRLVGFVTVQVNQIHPAKADRAAIILHSCMLTYARDESMSDLAEPQETGWMPQGRQCHSDWLAELQGVQRVMVNLDDTCLDSPGAKQRFADLAAAASSEGMSDAFSSPGKPLCRIACSLQDVHIRRECSMMGCAASCPCDRLCCWK